MKISHILVYVLLATNSSLLLLAQTTTSDTTTSTSTQLIATTTQEIATTTQIVAPITQMAATSTVDTTNTHVESRVREYFKDSPVMITIADCESRFRQYTNSGNVLGASTSGMIGVFQIYGDIHKKFALTKGFDIFSLDGNLGYAKYLYSKENTAPWMDSFSCWKSATNNPENATTSQAGTQTANTPTAQPTTAPVQTITTGAFTSNVSFGMTHSNVLILQQILNNTGFVIAQTGPGSLGNETMKFGSLTRDAVRRFQCAKQIVCTGDEGSTGYGYVGNRTRLALIGSYSTINQATTASQSHPANNTKEQIAQIEAQIQSLQNNIATLQAKLVTLKSGQ